MHGEVKHPIVIWQTFDWHPPTVIKTSHPLDTSPNLVQPMDCGIPTAMFLNGHPIIMMPIFMKNLLKQTPSDQKISVDCFIQKKMVTVPKKFLEAERTTLLRM